MSLQRKHLVRLLPKNYFGDCQITHFGAAGIASSGGSQAQQYAPADTHAAAPSIPANARAGVCTRGKSGGGEPSHAAGHPCNDCNDAHRLRAARILAGTY